MFLCHDVCYEVCFVHFGESIIKINTTVKSIFSSRSINTETKDCRLSYVSTTYSTQHSKNESEYPIWSKPTLYIPYKVDMSPFLVIFIAGPRSQKAPLSCGISKVNMTNDQSDQGLRTLKIKTRSPQVTPGPANFNPDWTGFICLPEASQIKCWLLSMENLF